MVMATRRPSKGIYKDSQKDFRHNISEADYIIEKDGDYTIAVTGKNKTEQIRNTDPTSVIQYALDALTDGGLVFVKPMDETLTSPITLNHIGLSLIGSGKSTKFTLANGVDSSAIIINPVDGNVTTPTYCDVGNMSLNGNSANQGGANYGVHIKNANNKVHDIFAEDFLHGCVGVGSVGAHMRNRVENCTAYNCVHYGFAITGMDTRIISCTVYNSALENTIGFSVAGSGSLVTNCIINDYVTTAIRVTVQCCNIVGNHLDASVNGIKIEGGSFNTIIGNTLYFCTTVPCELTDATDNIISGNIFCNADQGAAGGIMAMRLGNVSDRNIISDNIFVDDDYTAGGTQDYGIYVDNSDNNIFRDNSIGGNLVEGVHIVATCSDNRFTGNKYFDNTADWNDAGTRTTRNGVGLNAGVPGVGGDWVAVAYEGAIVRDTTNNKTYIYASGGWREISPL